MISVNKDLAKKVVDAMDELALGGINNKYTFTTFCEKNKLFNDNDKQLSNGEYFIRCPFHADTSPSLGISEDKRRWHCFSCGRSGGFVNLVLEYEREIAGRDISYYQVINEMLSSDSDLQKRLGASSVYVQEKPQDAFKGASYKRFKIQKSKPKTYQELATLMCNKKVDESQILFALIQMQSGVSAELIYSNIFERKSIHTESTEKEQQKQYDLEDLMRDDDAPEKIGGFTK